MRAADLPPIMRLRRAADFLALRQGSDRLSGHCFSVRYRSNGQSSARLGMAISKRVSKRAVDRNRLKRLIRESFRRVRGELPPYDLLIMARDVAVPLPGPELLAELDALWRRLPALKTNGRIGTMAD